MTHAHFSINFKRMKVRNLSILSEYYIPNVEIEACTYTKKIVFSLSSLLQGLKNKINLYDIIEQIIFSEFTCSYNEHQLTCFSDMSRFCSFVCLFWISFFICCFIFHLQILGNHKYKYLCLGLLLYDF